MIPPPLFQLQYLVARTRKNKIKFHPNHDNAYLRFPENLGIKFCFILFFWNKWEYPLQEKINLFHSCVFEAIKMYNIKIEKWCLQGLPPPRFDTNSFAKISKKLEKLVKSRLEKKIFLQDFPKILVKKDNCFL
jgi:hypothetical protein